MTTTKKGFCDRLPSTATKAELMAAHRNKMLWKKQRHAGRKHYPPEIRANLSRHHPDAGMTPREHAAAKLAR